MDSIRLSVALAMIALWFGPARAQQPQLPEQRYSHTASILGIYPDPNGKWLLTWGELDRDNCVRKWNLETMKPMPVAAGLRKAETMTLSSDGSRVAYSLLEEDPTTKQFRYNVRVADADGENPVLALSIPVHRFQKQWVPWLVCWNDEQFVCICTAPAGTDREPDIFIIDWKTAKVKEYQRGPAHNGAFFTPSQDGKLPFRSRDCKSIILWDLTTGKKWRELKPRGSRNVRLAVYHESSKMWAVVSDVGCTFFDQKGKEMFQKDDGLYTTWVVPGGRDLWYFANYSGSVYSMDYSPLAVRRAVTVYSPPAGPRPTTTNLIALVPKINWLAVASRDVPQNLDDESSGQIALVDLKSRQIRAVIENDTITVLDPPKPAVHRGD